MDEIEALFSLDFPSVIMSIFIILCGVLAIIKVVEELSKKIGKPVKWIAGQNRDHELLQQTVSDLKLLTEHHYSDMHDEADRDELMQQQLSHFAEEIKDSIAKTQTEMQQYTENRVHDREQSLEIQKQLSDSIASIAEVTAKQDEQIDNLRTGMMELLGDKIDERFSRYLSLNGIPENEISEFTGIYKAYAANGGNSQRKTKYEYVTTHMRVIPVETNLLETPDENEVD